MEKVFNRGLKRVLGSLALALFAFCFVCSARADEVPLEELLSKVEDRHARSFTEFMQSTAAYETLLAKGKKANLLPRLRERVILMGIQLVTDLVAQAEELKAQKPKEGSPQAQEYKSIQRLLSLLYKTQSGLKGLTSPFIILSDGNSNLITERNARPGFFSETGHTAWPSHSGPALGASGSARFRARLWRLRRASVTHLVHFGQTYSAFMIATGLLTFAHLATNYEQNPVALDQYIHHATDPLGAVSFGVFMAASAVTVKYINGIKTGAIPKSMIPYIGMAMGLVASGLFYELAVDKDLHRCITSGFKASKDCDKAFDRWVANNKILQYTPVIISLLTSVGAAGVLTSGLAKGVQAAKSQTVFSGISIGPKVQAVKNWGGAILKSRYLLSIGSFFIFLGIERQIGPPLIQAFERFRLGTFDLKAWSDRWYFHRDYWIETSTHQDPLFYVTDTFDVEATNLPTAHHYYHSLVNSWRDRQWSMPEEYDLAACYITGLMEASGESLSLEESEDGQEASAALDLDLKEDQKFRKPKAMRSCEILSQPARLIDRYAMVEDSWRMHLNANFFSGLLNWIEWGSSFSQDYILSYRFYEYLMQQKLDHSRAGTEPDLSKTHLLGKLIELGGVQDPEIIKLPEFQADYERKLSHLLHSMACGPQNKDFFYVMADGKKEKKPSHQTSEIIKLGTHLVNVEDYHSFRTPVGSPARFRPPALVDEPGESICQYRTQHRSPFNNHDYVKAALKAKQEGRLDDFVYNEVFDSSWTNPKGEKFESLAHYIYAKANRDVWWTRVSRQSGLNSWWQERVQEPVAAIWSFYEKRYKDLYYTGFIPRLFKQGPDYNKKSRLRRRRGGAKPMEGPFFDLDGYSTHGAIQSYEKEFHNYFIPAQEILDELSRHFPHVPQFFSTQRVLSELRETFYSSSPEVLEMASLFPPSIDADEVTQDKKEALAQFFPKL